MTDWAARDTGVRVGVPPHRVLERRLKAADRPGEHLWVVTAAWACPDPERPYEETVLLDAETLIGLAGPGCFKCEREYSRKLAKMPCRGSVDDLQ